MSRIWDLLWSFSIEGWQKTFGLYLIFKDGNLEIGQVIVKLALDTQHKPRFFMISAYNLTLLLCDHSL